MKLMIRESGELVGIRIEKADTFWRRLRGLMLANELPEGHGLHISPCRSVHSFFMKFPIDVLHLDETDSIVGMEPMLGPGRLGAVIRGTHSVVELPAGTLARKQAQLGQMVDWYS